MLSRFFSLSLRTQMMAMILLMASVPLGIIAYSAHRQYLWELHDASHDAQRIAAEIEDNQNALISGAEQLLTTLVQVEAVKTRDAAAVNRLLADLINKNHAIANIMIIKPSGEPWASAVPMPNPMNLADRRYFRQALTTGRLSSGEYAIGRVLGVPVLQFGYPVKDDTGKIRDIGMVNFKLSGYGNLSKVKGLPAKTSLLLTDHKGTILFSATRPELVGKQDRQDLFRRMQDGPDEGTFEAVGNTSVYRLFAYEKIRLPGEEAPYLYVRVGIDLDTVAVGSRHSLLVNSVVLVTVTLLVLLLVYFTSRRGILDKVAALRDATEKVASGDLSVRVAHRVTGGDLGRLGSAFDEMTGHLEHNISALVQAQDAVRQTLAEKETLIRELYHRTKNNMQIVRSLMNLQASDTGTETRAFVKEVDNRIQGLALVHEMLYQSKDLSSLDLTAYLDVLVRAIARNFWGHHSLVTVHISGDPLPVTLDIATPCGLVINELLSNTFKYAFPGGRRGVITVRISRDGPEQLLLEYTDNGVGLPEGFDPRSQETLGMQSIFAIVEQQLRGEVRIVSNTDGLTFALRIATGHYQERV